MDGSISEGHEDILKSRGDGFVWKKDRLQERGAGKAIADAIQDRTDRSPLSPECVAANARR